MDSTKSQARRAGLLYLLLGITAPFGLKYVPGKLIVSGDATATMERIRASEGLFRLGIASELVHQAIGVFVVLALYHLFKPVSQRVALMLLALGCLLSVPIMYVNTLNEIAVLILMSGAQFLSIFSQAQLESFAYFFLRLHAFGIDIASIFWGLWLFPFGWLVIRCGFIPQFLGYLLIVAGIGYLAAAFATILLPALAPRVSSVALILEMGELPIMLWLLIWGARARTVPNQGAVTGDVA